jgi:glycosyltransferase involved in cell wall biosynthesis
MRPSKINGKHSTMRATKTTRSVPVSEASSGYRSDPVDAGIAIEREAVTSDPTSDSTPMAFDDLLSGDSSLLDVAAVGDDDIVPLTEIEAREPQSYSIWLDGASEGLQSAFRLSGLIQNTGVGIWNGNVRIGLRKFRDLLGAELPGVEFRGVLNRAVIGAGQESEFSIEVDSLDIPLSAVTCEIDVVQEGQYWFAECGATALLVPVAGFHDSNSRTILADDLSRFRRVSTVEERRRLQILQEALRRYDFTGYDAVRQLYDLCIRHHGALPYRRPIASSSTVAASLSRNPKSRAAFMSSVARRMPLPGELNLADPGVVAPVFKEFISRSRDLFRDATPPLPQDVIRWLSNRALPVELAANPITRSMALACGDKFSFNFTKPENFVNAAWVYATSVLIDANLSSELVSDAMASQLATSPQQPQEPGSFPQLTGFMQRLIQEDHNYRGRYDITSDSGRLAYAFDLLLLGLDNEVRRFFLGQEVMQWLLEPISATLDISPFELLALGNSGDRSMLDLSEPSALTTGIRTLYDWTPKPATVTEYPLRVLGRYSTFSGLSTNMRMSLRVLREMGIEAEIVDTDRDLVIPAPKVDQPVADVATRRLSRPVDLFHLNLDDVPSLVARYSGDDRPAPYRIGFALWEASVMPEAHRAGAELMDELWVPSRYLEKVYRDAGFSNVRVVGKAIDVSEVEPLDRDVFGLPDEAFVFATSFDLDSWVDRKNPYAVVEAFQRAFPKDDSVRLVVKTTGIFAHAGDRTRQIPRILAAVDADPRIVLINERMSFGRYLGVMAMSDATLSSHRSEGFGYFPAYSLSLGRPTIVSDHSGTEDFCTTETAFPVSAPLIAIRAGDFVYDTPGAQWADIDVAALADTMRRVREDRDEREARTARGQALMASHYSYEAMAARYRERLEDIVS